MNQLYKNNTPWELIAKQLHEELNEQEAALMAAWLEENEKHPQILDELRLIWSEGAEYGNDFQLPDTELAWNKLQHQLHQKEEKIIPLSFWKRYGLVASSTAAVLLIAILAAYWLVPQLTTKNSSTVEWLLVQNELNSSKSVQMPDGSTIYLNKGASFSYPADFSNRQIQLKGEAFFEVQHDPKHPFQVTFAENASVTVLGTSFNIKSSSGSAQVDVLSGKVRFEAENTQLELSAGQGVQQQGTQWVEALDKNATSWKTGRLEFDNATVAEILEDLRQHYNKELELSDQNLKNCRFKGVFEQESLENILKTIAFSLELELLENQNKFLLKGKGCLED